MAFVSGMKQGMKGISINCGTRFIFTIIGYAMGNQSSKIKSSA